MPEIGLWHVVTGAQPRRLPQQSLPTESALESWIFEDPSLIAPSLHRVRRQVPLGTKFMDLLAIEEPGVWVVCELKKIALERESLAQAIDYMARLYELSRTELEALTADRDGSQSPETSRLVRRAFEREDSGEGRDVRIVLVGVAVKEELRRMVGLLSGKHGVPIRVCTLSAVAAPDGEGLLLMRDISEDSESKAEEASTASTYQQRMKSVRQHFASHQLLTELDAMLAQFNTNENLYVRPWKRSIMIAPDQNHSRYLAYFTARNGVVFASVGRGALQEFFPDSDFSQISDAMAEREFASAGAASAWAESIAKAVGARAIPPGATDEWNGRD